MVLPRAGKPTIVITKGTKCWPTEKLNIQMLILGNKSNIYKNTMVNRKI